MLLRERRDADAEVARRLEQARPAPRRTPGPRGAAAHSACGSPGGSPRSARTLRTPAAAYWPMMCRSSATEWSTAVKWPTGISVVSVAMPLGHRDGLVAGRAAGAVGHRDEGRLQRLELAQRRARACARPRRSWAGRTRRRTTARRRRAARGSCRTVPARHGPRSVDRPRAAAGAAVARPTTWTDPHPRSPRPVKGQTWPYAQMREPCLAPDASPLDAEDLRARVAQGAGRLPRPPGGRSSTTSAPTWLR